VTDAALYRLCTENRRLRAEKAMRRQISYREALPTQRPNGLSTIASPWFTEASGARCRLLCHDHEVVAQYVSLMMALRIGPIPDMSSLTPAGDAPMMTTPAHKERSCDTGYATGGSNTGSPLD